MTTPRKWWDSSPRNRDIVRKMRALGVVFNRQHDLPRYTAGMTEAQKAEADKLYEQMENYDT